ncbi:orotidine-5'-phosphate decarboxylase [Candidatus Woesearchaeota archaeon]|nr:orotidine-5'-phosphate decarboxylase [Candidatus Woesearchaeota archaeon]
MATIKLTEKEELARKRLCLPLDNLLTIDGLEERVQELSPVIGLFKIGKGSFTRFGPKAIEVVKRYNSNVFLDLKYHDIPNTVEDAAYAATQLKIYMFNVHASGGIEMMRAAVKGAKKAAEEYKVEMPKIVGVTILTSIDKNIMNDELTIPGSVESQVLNLALNSRKAGLDGVVCSAADLYHIKDKLPSNFMYVTPGIEGINTKAGSDQKRVFTPGNAIRDGSTILVAGRIITRYNTSEERLQAGYGVLEDMAKYL